MKMKKIYCLLLLVVCAVAGALVWYSCTKSDKPYRIVDGVIRFEEPKRVEGQTSMLGFAAEPIETVRIGIIGLGMRGQGPLKRMSFIEGAKIVAMRAINIKSGAPGGCPTSSLYDVAINSAQSHRLDEGSIVSRYVMAAMANTHQPTILSQRLKFINLSISFVN